jgi:hypothetical protein
VPAAAPSQVSNFFEKKVPLKKINFSVKKEEKKKRRKSLLSIVFTLLVKKVGVVAQSAKPTFTRR